HERGVRYPGRATDTPGATRLAGDRTRPPEVGRQGVPQTARDLGGVPPVVEGDAGGAGEGPRQPAALSRPAGAAVRRDGAGSGARDAERPGVRGGGAGAGPAGRGRPRGRRGEGEVRGVRLPVAPGPRAGGGAAGGPARRGEGRVCQGREEGGRVGDEPARPGP